MSTARIFISYASEDREDAAQVSAALQGHGHEVWWDRQLIAGDDFALKIEQQLDEADLVVVLWSQASAKSQFVRDEANRALQAGKLVPARVDDLWPLPLGFAALHTVDAFAASSDDTSTALNPQALAEELRRRLAAPPAPAPPPKPGLLRKRRVLGLMAGGASASPSASSSVPASPRPWMVGVSALGITGLLAGGYAAYVALKPQDEVPVVRVNHDLILKPTLPDRRLANAASSPPVLAAAAPARAVAKAPPIKAAPKPVAAKPAGPGPAPAPVEPVPSPSTSPTPAPTPTPTPTLPPIKLRPLDLATPVTPINPAVKGLIVKRQPSTVTALPMIGSAALVKPSLAASAVVAKPKD